MRRVAASGYSTATDLADWLTRALGLPFREAHRVTGALVKRAEALGCALADLPLAEMQRVEPRITDGGLRGARRSSARWRAAPASAAPRPPMSRAPSPRHASAFSPRTSDDDDSGAYRARAVLAARSALPLAACGKKGAPEPPPGEPNTYPRTYPSQ